MRSIKCIVIDDEPLARKGLQEYIADIDFLELAGVFSDPLQAVGLLGTGEVQLVFLDIRMPKISGLDFLRSLAHAPPVIFTTAYPQYALTGFDLNALDYLVKPVSFDRFLRASLKAKDYHEVRSSDEKTGDNVLPEENFFFIKADNKLVKILYDDILYAEALQNYVIIHTTDKKHITYLTFKSITDYLPAGRFVKTHKSFIVSASRVEHIEGNEILISGHRVPLSRGTREEVMVKLLKGRFLKR